jgi:hypothetical protein
LFSLVGSVCIASACLLQGDPLAGLLGCGAFAVLGGYIAFFHTPRDMVINFAIAVTTAAVLAARLTRYYDPVVAGSALLLVLVVNAAFSFAVQWLVHALGSDLRSSGRDALTGLLTRRTFYQSTYALLLRPRDGPRSDRRLGEPCRHSHVRRQTRRRESEPIDRHHASRP